MSLHLSKWHIVGNHMSRLICIVNNTFNDNYKPLNDKTSNLTLRLAKTQASLIIRPVRPESVLCDQRVAKDPRFLHATAQALFGLDHRWAQSYWFCQLPHTLYILVFQTIRIRGFWMHLW